jgi:hypothetical protein
VPSYRVSEATFYKAFPAEEHNYSSRIELGIRQLVRRYGITGKSVLSLGAGTATEEYYFWKHGNRLTLVDIDEYKRLEPVLQTLPSGEMHYIIADANDVVLDDDFDVFYSSSFAPDELRRGGIVRQRDTDTFRRMLELNDGIWEWPWWEEPFHPVIMRFAQNLRPSGLMIVQSYAGGFDVLDQRYYMWACDRQLATAGMTLIEAYRFTPTTGVMLYVAAKGPTPSLPLSALITQFHGRGQPERVQCLRLLGPPPTDSAGSER